MTNFRRQNWRFLENQCYDQIFAKVVVVRVKKAKKIGKFFGENIFKITTSVPEGKKVENSEQFSTIVLLLLLFIYGLFKEFTSAVN
jgi:hypothetical protein